MIETMEAYVHVHGRRKEKLATIVREWANVEVVETFDDGWFVEIPDCDGKTERYEISEPVYETALYVFANKRWLSFLARYNHRAAKRGDQVL